MHRDACSVCSLGDGHRCAKYRIRESLPIAEYQSFLVYISYVFYTPLYLAGPIISFNDFLYQMRNQATSSISFKTVAVYALRWGSAALLMEIMMHLFHVVAISKARAWDNMSPFEMSMIGFFNLKFVWLKVCHYCS